MRRSAECSQEGSNGECCLCPQQHRLWFLQGKATDKRKLLDQLGGLGQLDGRPGRSLASITRVPGAACKAVEREGDRGVGVAIALRSIFRVLGRILMWKERALESS